MMNQFLSIRDLTREQVTSLIELAFKFKSRNIGFYGDREKSVLFLFLEPSTRTKLSFQVACQRCGLNILEADPSRSSLTKGETLFDMLKNVEALGAEVAIVRLSEENELRQLARDLKIKIISAGEGKKEHPSQALLDAMTIYENFKTLDGLKISIIGDVKHSRVAHSLMDLFSLFNSELRVFSPPEFGEVRLPYPQCEKVSLEEAYSNSDILILLRNQLERHSEEIIDKESYLENYGLNQTRLATMKQHSIIMHPGPFQRGVELCPSVLEDQRVKIFEQVKNGVFARMAILKEVLDG